MILINEYHTLRGNMLRRKLRDEPPSRGSESNLGIGILGENHQPNLPTLDLAQSQLLWALCFWAWCENVMWYIHIYMYVHAYIHTYRHACMHAYLHPYIQTCRHAYMHTIPIPMPITITITVPIQSNIPIVVGIPCISVHCYVYGFWSKAMIDHIIMSHSGFRFRSLLSFNFQF